MVIRSYYGRTLHLYVVRTRENVSGLQTHSDLAQSWLLLSRVCETSAPDI